MERNDDLTERGQQALKGGRQGYSWYSRLTTTKKIILWLISVLAILAIALGVGLGVGLGGKSNGDDD